MSDKIHENILELRNKGAAILLITSDFDELFRLSDRIELFMKENRYRGAPETFDPTN